jgi:hypothetical protein
LPTRYLTARDVLRFRDEAFLRYYTNPHYLEMVDRKFGPEVVQNLRQMTEVRLERDLLNGKMQVVLPTLPTEEAQRSRRGIPVLASSRPGDGPPRG